MQKHLVMLAVCGALIASAVPASAQFGPAWTDRGYVTLDWAAQADSGDLSGSSVFTKYDEDARLDVTGKGAGGGMIDFSVGARVWRNVSVGLAFNSVSSTNDATLSGSIPHPLFAGQPRTFTQSVRGLKRTEGAIHLQFGYMWVLNEKIDVHIYGGPTFFRVSQDVVDSVEIGEQGSPYTSVVVQPTVAKQKDSPVGGHFGVDGTYQLYTIDKIKLGVGGFFRWAGGTATIKMLEGGDVKSDVGGAQGGVGLRVRF